MLLRGRLRLMPSTVPMVLVTPVWDTLDSDTLVLATLVLATLPLLLPLWPLLLLLLPSLLWLPLLPATSVNIAGLAPAAIPAVGGAYAGAGRYVANSAGVVHVAKREAEAD